MSTFRYTAISTALILLLASGPLSAGEKNAVSLRDFFKEEVKSAGFTLPRPTSVRIRALGDGTGDVKAGAGGMFAYGWIIDAETREAVWVMKYDKTTPEKKDRLFDGTIPLPAGSYEVYYAAFAFGGSSWISGYSINIDRRKPDMLPDHGKKKGIFSWFEEFFGEEPRKVWEERSREWGIDVFIPDDAQFSTFTPPMKRKNTVYRSAGMGENERIRVGFRLSEPVRLGFYCLGELDYSKHPADYGWIIDRTSRKRICEMTWRNTSHAGGAKKNMMYNGAIEMPAGDYLLYYNTDDSHSSADWNDAPPYDPLNYGVMLYVTNPGDASKFSLTSGEERETALIRLTGAGDGDQKSASFTLKAPSSLRVYAIGEQQHSRRQMADYGWIINARTREKVWTMDPDRTEHAGGGEKNRMIDEIITLPAGAYTVNFITDDSHSYGDWNDAPPIDGEHWGITIYPGPGNFDPANFSTGSKEPELGVIAQITRVVDETKKKVPFTLKKATRVRIYAIGEGMNQDMYDYGWIEKAGRGNVVWEMTYAMTFHAGGGKKNRMANVTLTLEPGDYNLWYTSDDSHSFRDWNTDPPDDPTMWGITLYEEQ